MEKNFEQVEQPGRRNLLKAGATLGAALMALPGLAGSARQSSIPTTNSIGQFKISKRRTLGSPAPCQRAGS